MFTRKINVRRNDRTKGSGLGIKFQGVTERYLEGWKAGGRQELPQ
jgi:hypothetical protein